MAEVYNNEDVKTLQAFAQFVTEKATYEMDTKDAINYVKLMQAYNKIVTRMGNDLVSVQYPEDPQQAMRSPVPEAPEESSGSSKQKKASK